MTKYVFVLAVLLFQVKAQAQPWIENYPATKNIHQVEANFNDWLSQQKHLIEEAQGVGTPLPRTIVKEGYNYHFERWKYYWQQRADTNGNIIDTRYKWQEYERLKQSNLLSKTTTNQSNWSFIGPDSSAGGYSGLGRINTIAFHPTDVSTYIIGAAGGGAWRTVDDGMSWTVMYNDLPVLGVSDIDYNPQNPNTIYLCTGDRDAGDTYSVGLLRSYDNGITWETTASSYLVTDAVLLRELIINPIDTNSLTLATSQGIFKSNTAANTFSKVLNGHFKQLVYHPVDTNIIYASGRENGANDNIYKSTDGGYTWVKKTAMNNVNNLRLAVTPLNTSLMKAVAANTSGGLEGIYSSSDTGNTFVKIYSDSSCTTNILSGNTNGNGCGGQGWYDLSIAISNADTNEVIVGGVNSWVSYDGGYYFQIANQWYSQLPGVKTVHADKHFHAYQPLRPGYLFECNDGGIYRTTSPASLLWDHLTNKMGITQFYRNAVSNVNDAVLGGAQDNGSKLLRNGAYRDLTGGDGMNCEMDPVNPSVMYTAVQYGTIYKSVNGGNNFSIISNSIPGGQPTGGWITPFAISPVSPNIIVAGYKKLYVSQTAGTSWTALNISNNANCQRISISMADPNILVVNFSTNVMMYSNDFGQNFSSIITSTVGAISDLLADPLDADKIWVAFRNINGNKVGRYSVSTAQWDLYNTGIPNIAVQCITMDTSNKTMYVGTDFGVYFRDTTMTAWEKYDQGLPNIEVSDLGIDYTKKNIVAATYGRGMWQSPKHEMPPASNITTVPFANNVLNIFPNPSQGTFTVNNLSKAWMNQALDYTIYNTAGIQVFKGKGKTNNNGEITINNNLPSATYLLELRKADGQYLRGKFIHYK